MSDSLLEHCRQRLEQIEMAGRTRRRRRVEGGHGVHLHVDGVQCLNFCSNDYLGLAADPRLSQALEEAATRVGVGSAASQLVTGYNVEHAALEAELADWVGRERALLFSTGYAANLGTIGALLGKRDHIVADALNHASLIDGSRLAGASKHIYPHADTAAAEAALADCNGGQRLLVTDSVFSMDGDTAPLAQLSQSAQAHDAWLAVDDAHGLGVFGASGAGRVAQAGLASRYVPLLTATLGKSVGAAGAFVAGDETVIETIAQSARSFIFSTAMPPAVAAAARVGVEIARAADVERAHLQALIARFRQGMATTGLPLGDSDSPIQPVIIGAEARACALSEALRLRGFLVGAIRPPTVAPGTSRLRVTLTAAHTAEQVDALVTALGQVGSALADAPLRATGG